MLTGPTDEVFGRPVRRSARAFLVDEDDQLVLLRRTRPGMQVYWTTPGGGVEPADDGLRGALHRELLEELGATCGPSVSVFLWHRVREDVVGVHYFFLTRLTSIDSALRSGPELTEPGRGLYEPERFALLGPELEGIDLRPGAALDFLVANREVLLAELATLERDDARDGHAADAAVPAPITGR